MESGEESRDRRVAEEAALTSQSWRRCERSSLVSQGRERGFEKLLTTTPVGSGVVPGLCIVTGTMAATKGDNSESKLPHTKECRLGFPKVL